MKKFQPRGIHIMIIVIIMMAMTAAIISLLPRQLDKMIAFAILGFTTGFLVGAIWCYTIPKKQKALQDAAHSDPSPSKHRTAWKKELKNLEHDPDLNEKSSNQTSEATTA